LNEEVGTLGPQLTPWSNTLSFTVPQGAIPGVSRMRVVGQYNPGSNPTFDACDNTPWFGATEDYTIIVNGSVAYPVSYLWSNGATTDSIFGLSAGTYTVLVTDANGCRASDTVIVSLNGISASVILTDSILCYGDLATIDVITSGGIGWYLYQLNYWTPFWGGMWIPFSQQTTYDTATFSSVPANTYQIIVSDTNQACSSQISIVITQPNPLSITMSSTSTTCYDTCDGNVISIISGGTPSYTFLWSNGSTAQSIPSACVGNYNLIVTDSNGCIATDSVMVGISGSVSATTILIDTIKCYGDLAIIDVITSCGSGWYNYSLEFWTPILGGMWLPLSQQTTYDTATFSSVPAYNYRVTITDSVSGGTAQAFININQPQVLSLNMFAIPTTCNALCDGIASVVVSGGTPPYSLLWPNGATTSSITGLCAGLVNLTVTDSFNCTQTSNITITQPNALSLTMSANQTICNGGTPSSLNANSGVSGTYSWSPPSAFTNPNLQNPAFNSGVNNITTYIVTFIDANGCIATDSVTITVNPIPTVTLFALPSPACVGDNIQLTANTSLPVNSYRFQYDDGSGWIDMTSPVFTSTNPMNSSPFSSTTQFRVKVREYMGCNPSLYSPIITVPISTVATQPINHY